MYSSFFKPFFDRFLALLLLILISPLFLIISLFIRLQLGSPIFFRQPRPGLNGKLFKIYKFRTMSHECDVNGNLLPDAQRLNGIGKTIRSLSLDELPQLFNVIKGEMSFIGPRPLLEEYLPLYSQKQSIRHNVRPGITGWAQVNGRNAISWEKKFQLDVYYVHNISLMLDFRIILLTIQKIVKRSDISQEGHVTVEKFNGHN